MGNRQSDVVAMMSGALMLVALALASAVAAAPAHFYENPEEMVIPQKRAALVLDRILIALQKALHEPRSEAPDGAPRASALRLPYGEASDMSALQRRGQAGAGAGARGRVLRCYFNAVTCF